MAGKAVAVAKAVVKKPVAAKAVAKPVAKAKKPTAKATGKVVAKAAKKPAAKKPAVAKFNLNKLMMLIVRDAPKKGKKMMGGYKKADTDIAAIQKTILDFLIKDNIRERILSRIREVYTISENQALDTIRNANTVGDYLKNTDVKEINKFISYMINDFGEEISNIDVPVPAIANTNTIAYNEKRVFNINLMIIVRALCQVYVNFTNYAENITDAEKIKKGNLANIV